MKETFKSTELFQILESVNDNDEVVAECINNVPVCVSLIATPHQISNIGCEKIILVQKNSENLSSVLKLKSISSTPSKSTESPKDQFKFEDDLNVTGSPLKCSFPMVTSADSPFIVELKEEERDNIDIIPYAPLPYLDAYKICNEIISALKLMNQLESTVPPVLIATAGDDINKTLFLGVSQDTTSTSQISFRSHGPFTYEKLPTMDQLICYLTVGSPSKMVESTAQAEYRVLTSEENFSKLSINLQCTWKRPTFIMSYPDTNVVTNVNLSVNCSDMKTDIIHIYLELLTLKGLIKGLRTGEVEWFESTEEKMVKENLDNLFTRLREQGPNNLNSKNEDTTNQDFFNRPRSLDFTDHLWTILMKCDSYKELTESLALIFENISNGYIRPQIHVQNITQIGTEGIALMKGQTKEPELAGLRPLQMLIEIGIEKLKRDYMHIFHVGQLATAEFLTQFHEKTTDLTNFDACLEKLQEAHITLHSIVALYKFLNFPTATLAQYTTQILSDLKTCDLDCNHNFTFSAQRSHIKDKIEGLKLNWWEVTLTSDEANFYKQLVFKMSERRTVCKDYIDSELKPPNSEDYDIEYYCTHFMHIKDSLFV